MPDFGSFLVSFDTSTADVRAPVISNLFPADQATDVAIDTSLSFDVTDFGEGVIDQNSLGLTINGEDALVDGMFMDGFTGSITPLGNGYHVVVTPHDPLMRNQLHEITATASDMAGNTSSASWSFTTEVGPLETPLLNAAPADARIYLSWTTNPDMRVDNFELRRNTSAAPTLPTQGQIVYSGPNKSFVDYDVENGVTYFYTIFALHKPGTYATYDEKASDDATPKALRAETHALIEYVPARGEFGPATNPVPHGRTTSVWGRRQSDLITVDAQRPVLSPVRGRIKTAGQRVEVETKTGLVLSLDRFSVLPNLVSGTELEVGQVIGRTIGGYMEFAIFKKPGNGFGKRTVRPFYFYLTAEKRDGRL